MFPSIKDAFKNGSGDVFFKNENGYVAVSRHSVNFEEMAEKGYSHVPHNEVLNIAKEQEPQPIKEMKPAPVAPKNYVYHSDMEVQSYYDEFPDAYNQNL
jgi:hypothetical protein